MFDIVGDTAKANHCRAKCGPEDIKCQCQNPNRHALYSHLYLYINLMEWHTGHLRRRHLMPCQNITPLWLFSLTLTDYLVKAWSVLCLPSASSCWQAAESDGPAENGCIALDSKTHIHWPIYLLFVPLHNSQLMWCITFVHYQSLYFQILSWNYDCRAMVTVFINSKLQEEWQISWWLHIKRRTMRQLVFYSCWAINTGMTHHDLC